MNLCRGFNTLSVCVHSFQVNHVTSKISDAILSSIINKIRNVLKEECHCGKFGHHWHKCAVAQKQITGNVAVRVCDAKTSKLRQSDRSVIHSETLTEAHSNVPFAPHRISVWWWVMLMLSIIWQKKQKKKKQWNADTRLHPYHFKCVIVRLVVTVIKIS